MRQQYHQSLADNSLFRQLDQDSKKNPENKITNGLITDAKQKYMQI